MAQPWITKEKIGRRDQRGIIHNMIPENAKGRSARRETSETSGGGGSERNKRFQFVPSSLRVGRRPVARMRARWQASRRPLEGSAKRSAAWISRSVNCLDCVSLYSFLSCRRHLARDLVDEVYPARTRAHHGLVAIDLIDSRRFGLPNLNI